ncbi:unnamed protein product [Sphenostylis stenocarpa]|uniref:Uncharacterized protein n=1 Tax=Sphenostylis stenocarpa TaxID=92480 RepID=A0AA86VR44_9FABA|nr:unnamed protein product [Sphenostylis stenocarpa]
MQTFKKDVCNLPACFGRARQFSWPYFWMKAMSLRSSAGLQGPLFTWVLSQHGALPFPMVKFDVMTE